MKEAMRADVRTLLVQQQDSDHPPTPTQLASAIPQIVNIAVANSSGGPSDGSDDINPVDGAQAGFFPDLDATAAAIVAQAGGGASVIVVPNSFMLQHSNDTIFVKPMTQKKHYLKMINAEAKRKGGISTHGLAVLMLGGDPVILLKESALSGQDALGRTARVCHELGHKLAAAETGAVFEHEVVVVTRLLGVDDCRTWLRRAGSDGAMRWIYIARTSTASGIDQLIAVLADLLSTDEMAEFMEIRGAKAKK
ncbi:MAG TPA: hypothetical protein VGL80_29250 [Pseudonocardiaceae bacterium]